ncbi:MAG: DNA repair and recombination protein RadA [Thermoproteota archaeon]
MNSLLSLKSMTPILASKLEAVDIHTVEALVITPLHELKNMLPGVEEEQLRSVLEEAYNLLGYGFKTGKDLLKIDQDVTFFTTGSTTLDKLIGGGVSTKRITEFVGPFASGKTQILMTVLAEALGRNPDVSAIFYDTEKTFNFSRFMQIVEARGMGDQLDSIYDRLNYYVILNTDQFMQSFRVSDLMIKQKNIKLILIDSLVAPFRAEYVGREVLWYRQQLLNRVMRQLLNYAKVFNLAVAITNQVVANPQQIISQDPTLEYPPVGGTILAHNADIRVYLRKSTGLIRVARLIDSSFLPPGEAVFRITEKGVEDVGEPARRPSVKK